MKVESWLYDHYLFGKHTNAYGQPTVNTTLDNVEHAYWLLIGGTVPDGLAAKVGGLADSRLAFATATISLTRCLLTRKLHPCPACGRLSRDPWRDWTLRRHDCLCDTGAYHDSYVVNGERCSGVGDGPREGRTWRVGHRPCRMCECHHHTVQIGK